MLEHPAIRAANKSTMRQRHGAALYYGSKLLAVGHNMSLRRAQPGASIHAEQSVLSKIPRGYKAEDLTLVVVRINPNGSIMSSPPCKRCRVAIQKAGIGLTLHS